jgi:hypothetical protein
LFNTSGLSILFSSQIFTSVLRALHPNLSTNERSKLAGVSCSSYHSGYPVCKLKAGPFKVFMLDSRLHLL